MNKLLALTFSLYLAGCSTLGPAGALAGAVTGSSVPSIDVEAVAGDKEESYVADIGKKQQATVINNSETADPYLFTFMVLIAVLGWMLPSPGEMWRGLVGILPWRRSK